MTRFEKVLKDIGNILEENDVSHGEFSSICGFLYYGYTTQENELVRNANIKFKLKDVLSNEWTKAHIYNQKKISEVFGENVKVSGKKEKD